MKFKKSIDIDKLTSDELESYNKVLQGYKDSCLKTPIVESAINTYDNYVYIKLIDGIEIICFVNSTNKRVQYCYDDNENDIVYCSTYEEARNYA